ncbi:MAG: DUF6658 family protein [Leptolyngbyaceae cyanobacterium bins.349]|nr:DUF6658 family protein [Leptolyngbyaceae cyanobacterium bins.349]
MEGIISFFKKLNLHRIVIVFVAGMALLLSTACSSNENMQASRQNRPNDVPVQMGANNNPYTMGADTKGEPVSPSNYGNQAYKKQQSDASSVIPGFGTLIASSVAGQDTTGLLYESSDQREGGIDDTRSTQNRAYQPEPITSKRQPIINRSNPDEKIMEGIGRQFKEASEFLTDGVQPSVESAKVKTYTGSNQAVAKQSDQDK